MTIGIETRGLTCRYGDVTAVDDLSVSIPAGTLCGLLGRNGSGKSTLLAAVAAFQRPSDGTLLVDGEDPYENPGVVEQICLVRETGDIDSDCSVSEALWLSQLLRPNWEQDYALELLDAFEVPLDKNVKALSLGQRSAVASTIGLASRAPLTLFDETYLGLDAVSRRRFYDELLGEYLRSGRTFVISSHLIGEIAPLLERVVVLDHGRLTLDADAESLRGQGMSITGPTELVDEATVDATVLHERRLGPTRRVTILGTVDDETRRRLGAQGLEFGPVPLEDLLVHLTDVGGDVQLSDPDADPTQRPAGEPRPTVTEESR
jgi:ABC-2 type transport system ATP-binding protein